MSPTRSVDRSLLSFVLSIELSNVIDAERLNNLKKMQNEIIIKQNEEYKQSIEQLHINIKTSEDLLVQLTKIETTKIALGIKI